MNEVVVSFVIPVFNQAELIKIWVDKFVDCDSTEVEVIIAGGGSGIRELICSYSDNRIRFVEITNRG